MESFFAVVVGEYNYAHLADVRNEGFSELSKNVDLKYVLVIDHVRKRKAPVVYVPSVEMLADVTTKNLSVQKFLSLGGLLRMR